jgi:hypothetical protein
VSEVSWAGLENEIVAVKSENTVFFSLQQSFSTYGTSPSLDGFMLLVRLEDSE